MLIRMIKHSTASVPRDEFDTRETWIDGIAVLSVRDAVDMLSAPRLREAIRAALEKAPVGLIVDLTDADFLASVGMSVLVDTQVHADAISVRFGVVADGAATSRPIRLLGIDALLTLYCTLDEALRDFADARARPLR
jgi:anti-sigma B factor antagonist